MKWFKRIIREVRTYKMYRDYLSAVKQGKCGCGVNHNEFVPTFKQFKIELNEIAQRIVFQQMLESVQVQMAQAIDEFEREQMVDDLERLR